MSNDQTPIPLGPHLETISDSSRYVCDAKGTHILIYCPKHKVGGFLSFVSQIWTLLGPIDFTTFVSAVTENGGIEMPTGERYRVWREACDPSFGLIQPAVH